MSSWRPDLIRFGTLGAAVFGLLLWIQVQWLSIAAWLMGRDQIVFHQQSDWILVFRSAVEGVPWLISVALLAFALRRRRWVPLLAFAGSQLLLRVALVAMVFGTLVVRDRASRTAFDSASWKAENGKGARAVRVHMVDDLLQTHRLVGMSRLQLESLLGVPPANDSFPGYDYVYWLGPGSSDYEWLVIKCERGAVVSAEVTRN